MDSKVTVLIVEESRTFSMYLALLLRRMGLQSLTAHTLESARALLSRGIIDFLIVGDQADQAPASLCVTSLAAPSAATRVPVMVISLKDEAAEREACFAAGCHAYLLKPVQPRELHEALYSSLIFPTGQRVNLRSALDLMVGVEIPGQGPQRLRLLTLSRGGALIASHGTVATGTLVSMDLPINGEVLSLTGSIIYNRKEVDAQTPYAFGLLFHKQESVVGDRIDHYLESILKDAGHPHPLPPGPEAAIP
jgi:CheY-like chemotaxis protein